MAAIAGRLETANWAGDNVRMTHDEHLEEFLAICVAVFERMKSEGTWLWPDDSTLSKDMIDSDLPSDL